MPETIQNQRVFNPSRLEIVRMRRGLSHAALANALGVHPRTITSWKSGVNPNRDAMSELVRISGFPEEFFFGSDLEVPSEDGVSFRSFTRMTARQRDMARSQGSLAWEVSQWIEKRFDLPTSQVPDLRHLSATPEAAADTLRQAWGLGELRIRNMVHLLESKGIRVFSLSIDAKEVDAFSTWSTNGIPLVLLNNFKSSERSRFDAAHELGHLILHRHGRSNRSRELEAQADAFASAFLMPSRSVIANFPRYTTIRSLIELKKIWGVALSAVVYRLHALKLISEWHYKALCIEIGKHGYRTHEPEELPRESSAIFPAILKELYETDGMGKAAIARELAFPVCELDSLWFGLTLRATSGTGAKGAVTTPPSPLFRVK